MRETCADSARVGLQELAARRQVVEDIADFDRRALRHAGFRHRRQRAAIDANLGAGRVRRAPASAGRNARPTRCSAALRRGIRASRCARGRRRARILLVAWRSMASRASSGSIPSPSSSTRISFLPPNSTRDGDAPRAGVDRVLDQLLDDRRRALDDFAGGDLVGEVRRKTMNSSHRSTLQPVLDPVYSGGRRQHRRT